MSNLDQLHATKKKLDGVSPSFCLAKWTQTTLHLYNGNTQSCHHVKSHGIDAKTLGDPAALHNTPEKIEARAQMLAGRRPAECEYCWKIEDRGELSDRVWKSDSAWAAPHFERTVREGVGERAIPTYLEVAFDSICQFKCMYCSPAYSTKWQKEIEEFGPYPTVGRLNSLDHYEKIGTLPKTQEERDRYIDAFWRWWPELAPRLHDLRVTGGEPFLSRETFKLIDELIERPQKHLNFSINTNMGFSANQREAFLERVAALQDSVKSVFVFTSIDTVGAQAEYIRYGLNYRLFHENLEAVLTRTRKPLRLSFMITVNNLCLPGLRDLMAVIRDLRQRYPHHFITLDTPYLRNPMHMSVELLPKSFVRYIDETVEFMKAHSDPADRARFDEVEIQRVGRIRELMTKSSYSLPMKVLLKRDFFRMFTEYDRRRGTDFKATFPEYAAFWKECSLYAFF